MKSSKRLTNKQVSSEERHRRETSLKQVRQLLFEAQGDDLAHALHQSIEAFRLRMAAAKGWNGGNEIALFVLLNQDGECSLGPHAPPHAINLSQSARLRFSNSGLPWPWAPRRISG